MVQAVIFDMDGLLINSEPLWEKVELEVFPPLGVPLTPATTKQTMGLRVDEVVRYWHHRYPWREPSQAAVAEKILDRMVEELSDANIEMPGVRTAFQVVKELGLPIALASSSSRRLIEAGLKNLGIKDDLKAIKSAQHEAYGKPHPGIYIHAAEALGIAPEHCLAFEDSINGVLAAKAAKMYCVAVPAPEFRQHKAFGIADAVLDSLEEVTPALLKTFGN